MSGVLVSWNIWRCLKPHVVGALAAGQQSQRIGRPLNRAPCRLRSGNAEAVSLAPKLDKAIASDALLKITPRMVT